MVKKGLSSKYQVVSLPKKQASSNPVRKCVIQLSEEEWVTLTNYGRTIGECASATAYCNKIVHDWLEINAEALPALEALMNE